MAFRNIWKSRTVDLKNSSSLEFAAALITKCHSTLEFIIKQPDIKNEIISEINLTNCDLIVWWEMLSTKEKRKELFDQGVKDAQNKINLSIDLKIDLKCQDQV